MSAPVSALSNTVERGEFALFPLLFRVVGSNAMGNFDQVFVHMGDTDHISDKWGFVLLKGWFVGGTSCTLQTLYAWLMRGFGIGMVGILIYRVLHLSLRCDSWHASYAINLVK